MTHNSRKYSMVPTAAAVAIAALAVAAPAQATEIGSVAAANQRIDGTPPGQPSRTLQLGNRIFADELIISSEIGSGQFVFLDQTTLTVSPGSEILLDRYVFDPGSGSGEIALTLTKGVLRFIGGKVTKTGEATVSTPHATIGIRGGIAAITVGLEGTNAVFLAGINMCVRGKTRDLCVTRPGGMATVKSSQSSGGQGGGTGAAPAQQAGSDLGEPEYAGVASPEQIGLIYSSTNTGGGGGTTQPMGPEVVASASGSAGLTGVGAESPGASSKPPVSTQGNEQQPESGEFESQSDVTTEAKSEPETSPTSKPPDEIVDGFMGGVKSDISTLGTSGFATFAGTATASISEVGEGGTVNFQQSGGYFMSYDFGEREGAATITGIAGTTFTAIVSEANAPAGEHFGGALFDGGNFSQVGTIDGAFFTSGSDTSAATAGSFDFTRQLDGVVQTGDGSFQADKLNQN